MFTREPLVPNHFELVYIPNQYYECSVSQETGEISTTLPNLTKKKHLFVTEILLILGEYSALWGKREGVVWCISIS